VPKSQTTEHPPTIWREERQLVKKWINLGARASSTFNGASNDGLHSSAQKEPRMKTETPPKTEIEFIVQPVEHEVPKKLSQCQGCGLKPADKGPQVSGNQGSKKDSLMHRQDFIADASPLNPRPIK